MSNRRNEIERLVDELGYATIDDIQDLNKCKANVMSAIDACSPNRILAYEDCVEALERVAGAMTNGCAWCGTPNKLSGTQKHNCMVAQALAALEKAP